MSLVIASQLVYFSLFPANNTSLAVFGAFSFLLSLLKIGMAAKTVIFAVMLFSVFAISLFVLSHACARKIAVLVIVFFMFASLSAYTISHYNSATYWQGTAPAQAGHWLDRMADSKSIILFDARDCINRDIKNAKVLCAEKNYSSIAGFWLNREILFADPTVETRGADYAVSQHELALERFKEFTEGISIYKLK